MKIVYSKTNCPGCDKLKKQYIREGIEFEEVVIGKDITLEQFIALFPNVKSVPFVYND